MGGFNKCAAIKLPGLITHLGASKYGGKNGPSGYLGWPLFTPWSTVDYLVIFKLDFEYALVIIGLPLPLHNMIYGIRRKQNAVETKHNQEVNRMKTLNDSRFTVIYKGMAVIQYFIFEHFVTKISKLISTLEGYNKNVISQRGIFIICLENVTAKFGITNRRQIQPLIKKIYMYFPTIQHVYTNEGIIGYCSAIVVTHFYCKFTFVLYQWNSLQTHRSFLTKL